MKPSTKLIISLLTLVVSFFLLRVSGWFGLGVLVGLILTPLYWFDAAHAIQEAPSASRGLRILGVLMGIPQALFGFLCAAVGLAIIGWVIYNTFVERQPQYTGSILTLGVGPTLVLFGCGWLFSAFRHTEDPKDGA